MDERKRLLMKLTACKFAQYELTLFLDTHPDCVEAMQALNMHRANAIKLKDEYECKYRNTTEIMKKITEKITVTGKNSQKWQIKGTRSRCR